MVAYPFMHARPCFDLSLTSPAENPSPPLVAAPQRSRALTPRSIGLASGHRRQLCVHPLVRHMPLCTCPYAHAPMHMPLSACPDAHAPMRMHLRMHPRGKAPPLHTPSPSAAPSVSSTLHHHQQQHHASSAAPSVIRRSHSPQAFTPTPVLTPPPDSSS